MKIGELEPRDVYPVEVRFGEIVNKGCAPQDVYFTTNRIELFYHRGEWRLPVQPRMDGVVRRGSERLQVVEMNKLEQGESVVLGCSEDGSEGIYVIREQKAAGDNNNGQFGFMTSDVSRERRVDYSHLATVLESVREEGGKIVWVLGPAVVHAGGIESMEWLIQRGYVGALLSGNGMAAHDIEHAMFGTSLGRDNSRLVENGHRKHLEAINAVRTAGSIKTAVQRGLINKGIMYECVRNTVPFVLTGSIRDDGPLPDTITDNLMSQDAMRAQTVNASCVVMLATALHSIATGNMTPIYRVVGDEIRALPIVCVDNDEFTVTKLVDRGTGQAYPVITNVREFLPSLIHELEKQINSNVIMQAIEKSSKDLVTV